MTAEPKTEADLIRALAEDLALEILASYNPDDFTDADFTSLGLAVTLTVKGAGGQNRADRLQQGRIRHRSNRTGTPRRIGPGGGEMPIHAGPRRAPDPAHAGQAIGPAT